MLVCLLASGCSQTTTTTPITVEQNAPAGLSEALAGAEANRHMQDCRARMNDTVNQMKAMGAVTGAVGIADRMAGPGGKLTAKMVAAGAAGAVRDKLSRQMRSCSG